MPQVSPFLLIHSARQLVTVRGGAGPRRGPELRQLQVIEDGAVLIEGGRIREVGPTRRVENLAAARTAREISAAGRVVMPGFVDCHTHLISGPSRVAADAPRETGPGERRAKDARIALLNVGYVRDTSTRRLGSDATAALRQALAHGTTTLEAKSGSALSGTGETKILRILTALGDLPVDVVPTFFGAHVTAPEFEGRPAEHMEWVTNELLPTVHRRGLARFADGCADLGAFPAELLRPYYARAAELGLPLKLHCCQFGPSDGVRLAGEFQFTSIDHLEHAVPGCVEAVARSGAIATVTPASSFFLGGPRAPARELIAAGAAVALGSNFDRLTAPTHNMQLVVFLACHDLGFTPAEAVAAATINAAHALKLGHRIGSIEADKQADLLILNVGDYREMAYEFGVNLVSVTIKRGAVVFDSSGVKWPGGS